MRFCHPVPRAPMHVSAHCNTLQHTLQHTATHCNTLQHTATHCNTLQHTCTAHLCKCAHTHSKRKCTAKKLNLTYAKLGKSAQKKKKTSYTQTRAPIPLKDFHCHPPPHVWAFPTTFFPHPIPLLRSRIPVCICVLVDWYSGGGGGCMRVTGEWQHIVCAGVCERTRERGNVCRWDCGCAHAQLVVAAVATCCVCECV